VNARWLADAGIGFVVLSLSVAGARRPRIGPAESRSFHAINGLPDGLHPFLWVPMQLGNLVVGLAAGLLVAWLDGDATVAVGVVLAAGLKLVVERFVRRWTADALAVRQRPGTSQVGAVIRGDVPASGPSFPSGHVILAAGVGCVVASAVPLSARWIPIPAVLLVMLGRVYVGAHNPLDVTAGLGAGLLLGGAVASFVA
jgi:undecaprenyl-diphosphatase